MSVLYRWEHLSMSVLWVTLTTAVGGDAGKLRVHLREIERRAAVKTGHRKIEHVVIDTDEGNGTLHVLWAAPGSLYVDSGWLSVEWEKIHGAKIVKVNRYRRGSRGGLSRYLVSQYMGGQRGGRRISWSWKTTFGIPIKRVWGVFKRNGWGISFRELLNEWETFLRGETANVGGLFLSIANWRTMWGYLQVRDQARWSYA